ncbi:MAG: DUF1080 domain-containing protein [Planctomycetaceae bacterium]|nr:DUF1080 domain-containing protein [Planctomycetaceae bacterium]
MDASAPARIALQGDLPNSYELKVEFTRFSGDEVVALILPFGDVSPALEFSGWQGASHGLSRVDGLPSKGPQNPASVKPGILKNGTRYSVTVKVEVEKEIADIKVTLNDQKLFDWNGDVSRLKPNYALNLPSSKTLGLAVSKSNVTFHKVELLSAKPKTTPTPSPAGKVIAGQIDLKPLGSPKTPGWELFNQAGFTIRATPEGTVAAGTSLAAQGDRGAYVGGSQFENGTIDVEVKGAGQPQSSFLGVVFHGVDGENYEAVYFRPFNFGAADQTRRGHAIQYIAHPDWPWQKLRQQRPEEYENPVSPEPKPTDWVRMKVVVDGDRIQVFVNDSRKASLDVKRLGKLNSGKVGLWCNGVASYRNFKVTLAK